MRSTVVDHVSLVEQKQCFAEPTQSQIVVCNMYASVTSAMVVGANRGLVLRQSALIQFETFVQLVLGCFYVSISEQKLAQSEKRASVRINV